MKNTSPKKYRRWEKQREKGQLKFILINGVLCWGGFMSVFMNLYYYLRNGTVTIDSIAVNSFIFLVMGIIWGALTWAMSENSYQKHLKNKNQSNQSSEPT